MVDNFDLNLLRVFDAIIRHEHLGKAADELGVTQPSVSYALKQLRELIGDPLFVRAQRGMQPTPRALAIAPVIKSMLEDVREQVLSTPPFDAARSTRTFRLAMPDVSEMAMLPTLLPRLAEAAPSVDVCIVSMDQRELTLALQRSEVDLAVGYYPDLDGHDVFQQLLFRQTFTCLVRSNHPVLSTGMDREAFQAYPHAVVRIRGNSYELVEEFLQSQQVHRRKMLESTHFLVLPMVIAKTDMIAILPAAVAQAFTRSEELQVVDAPYSMPVIDVKQYWHRSQQNDRGNRWLRAIINELFSGTGR